MRQYVFSSCLPRSISARQPRVIRSLTFGVHAENGHLPALYYLTPAGAELLAEANQDEPVALPERVHRFANDYLHRINTINCHITIRQWAAETGSTLEFFDTYFDHSTGRKPRTQVAIPKGYIIQDAVFRLLAPDGEARLFALEMYNGRETHRVERQIARYLSALEHEAIEDAYNHHAAIRVLCVFDVFDELRGVCRRRGAHHATVLPRLRPEAAIRIEG